MSAIAVIGGGPAGLMAAISAAGKGSTVTVLDHSAQIASKLLLTGGGRCNFTNRAEPREFVQRLGKRGRFLGHALAALSPSATRTFFESIGVPSKMEPDGRVVPVSERAVNVRRALLERLESLGGRVITGRHAASVIRDGRNLTVICTDGRMQFDRVVLATGGRSYPATGSDGSGYLIARGLGHSIATPLPAEVPLVTSGIKLDRLQGLAVDGTAIYLPGTKRPSAIGSVLFTHFGISGPPVLDISGDVSAMLAVQDEVLLHLDFLPSIDREDAEAMMEEHPGNLLNRLPSRLAGLLRETSFSTWRRSTPCPAKRFPVTVRQTRGFEAAMVTRGGVELSEVDPATMQSKLCPGLFLAGEVLDLDGPMGGFNLQIAWSTGYLAGTCAARTPNS